MRISAVAVAADGGGDARAALLSPLGFSFLKSATMDDMRDKYMNPTPYYCNICKIYCASAINLQSHFLGVKHKAVEEALKAHGIVKPLSASGEAVRVPESLPDFVHTEPEKSLGRTLEEQLNSCKDSEPALGLQYIIEYRSKENPIYECNLCICQAGLTNMFMHVLGIKHRIAYLKKHRPDLADVKGRGSKLNLRLKEIAAKVEQEEGRQPIRSTMDLPILKEDVFSIQLSDSLFTSFTEDDDGKGKKKEDPKSTDKKAEEESKAKDNDSNKSDKKKESEQSTSQMQNALFADSDSDSEEFNNNEDLLKYLKSFEIVDEDDAAFILKVTQKFTDALILYREKASDTKNISEQTQPGNVGAPSEQIQPGNVGVSSEQKTYVGALGPRNDDFSDWELPNELSFEGAESNSSVKTPAKRKASELHTEPAKDEAKTPKRGAFVPPFKELPKKQDSCDPEGPVVAQGPRAVPRAVPRSDRRPNAGRGLDSASRVFRGRGAARGQPAPSYGPRGRGAPSSFRNQPRVPASRPSQPESNTTARFSSSARKTNVDEFADTLLPSPAVNVPAVPRKAVWIVGHYIVYHAAAYAASSGWGSALGLEDRLQITWMGDRGMQWDDLLPKVSLQVSLQGAPAAVIIHLGESDLPDRKGIDLNITTSADLHTLISRFPNTRIFWSEMVERREWPGANSAEKVDLVRRKVSAAASRLVEAIGGSVIRHPDISYKQIALFKDDGINLSEWGLDIWLHSIRYGLLCWLQSSEH
ncbi:uncharacterized protein LOC143821052 [Paroedura picta]|uniref:uncharacterized protein LOC143821052 n=1 Tax=Paroedura picta TaxID=143630 RepID=UPI004056DE1E